MEQEFKTVRALHKEGLLHKPLLTRIRILTAIAVLLLLIAVYDAFRDNLHGWICVLIAVVTFLLGLFVFSRISPVVWNEEKEIISAGRMDMTGFALLVLYILFDLAVKSILHAQYPNIASITGYVFCAIGGSLLGRSVGTRFAVYRLARAQESV